MLKKIVPPFALFAVCLASSVTQAEAPKDSVVNAVVASVDGKPITLQDLMKRLPTPRRLTLKEASLDPEANAALDGLIMESLVLQEAEAKRLSVGNEEIDQYIDEVAKRNSLSREGFEKALKQEGKNLTDYKNFVKFDILKSRLASNLMQAGVGVSDEDIEQYLKEHPELASSGTKVKLAHIVVSEDKHGSEGAQKILAEISKKADDGDSFMALARTLSDSPDAAEGGLLGIIAQKDLSSDIFEAISAVPSGNPSKPVRTAQGWQVFQVLEQYEDEKDDDARAKIVEEVRKSLQRQKLEQKMSSFFTAELMKAHAVDRKI
jgi:peptidyl-prolyl cis-trans isomerase SurA